MSDASLAPQPTATQASHQPAPKVTPSDVLVDKTPVSPPNFADNLMGASRTWGRGPFAQLMDILRLTVFSSRVTVDDYYKFGLFDTKRLSRDDQRMFVGDRANRRFNYAINNPKVARGFQIIDDKPLLNLLLNQSGIPAPTIQALASINRQFGQVPAIATEAALAEFLRTRARYPLFGKPMSSSLSMGAASINHLSADGQSLVFASGQKPSVDAFAAEVFDSYGEGFLFQDRIQQHPDLVKICGEAVGTVRLVTIREGVEMRPFYALWKIPSTTAVADNFWRKGNMVALLDVDTGEIVRVREGTGASAEDVTTHGETGVPLLGLKLPFWDEVRAIAVLAAKIVPTMRILGWDIAISPTGPIIVEGNTNPSHPMYQVASGRGLLSPETVALRDRIVEENKQTRKALVAKSKKNFFSYHSRRWDAILDQQEKP
jgi:hypothetical protein